MSDDKRCGTCRHCCEDSEIKGESYCSKPLPASLPQWARQALDWIGNSVEQDDGTDCDAWERKP